MISVYRLILAGVSILVILAVFMAVLSHVHLDHVDVSEITLPSCILVGMTAYWLLLLSHRKHYLRNPLVTRLKRVSPTLGH